VVQKSRVAEQFRLRIMDYDNYFREHLEALTKIRVVVHHSQPALLGDPAL